MGACCDPKPVMTSQTGCCPTSMPEKPGSGQWWRLGVCLVLAGLNMMLALGMTDAGERGEGLEPFSTIYWSLHGFLLGSSVISFALLGWPLLVGAWSSLARRRLTLESLFLLSALGALLLSAYSTFTGRGGLFYDVIPVVLAIYWFGKLLGESSRERANEALAGLRAALDTVSVVVPGAAPERRARASLQPGDRLAILAGETLPVDGTVTQGRATLIEAAITGEPFPVAKTVGDLVHAGSVIADDGWLEVAPSISGTSRLDAVLSAVDRALDAPSNIQRDADRILGWFLPFVVAAGLATFGAWSYFVSLEQGLRCMLAVYLVACPCALGLATPVAVMSALHRLGSLGIAPRNGDLILRLAEVDTVALDKTGTLGEGLPAIEELRLPPSPPVDGERLSALVAAVESRARHPLAEALARLAVPAELRDLRVEAVPGQGVIGKWQGGELRIGEPGLMPATADFSFAADLVGKRVALALDGIAAGMLILRETLRADARVSVRALRDLGLEVVILTGDPSPAWEAIEGAGVRSGLSPSDKAAAVRALSEAGRKVLFVGDGLNDLQGMSEAHATLAMAAGADLTRHSCDGVLAVDRLLALPAAIRLGRKVRADLRVNLLLSVGYNFVGIGLAAAGLLAPWVAALFMLSSSLLVAARAVRSTRPDPEKV